MTYRNKTIYIDQNGLSTARISVRVQLVRKQERNHFRPAAKSLMLPRS